MSTSLARNSDPETSHDAAAKVDRAKGKEVILQIVLNAGEYGITMPELCDDRGWQKSHHSSRASDLASQSKIFYRRRSGKIDSRGGARVMRHAKFENFDDRAEAKVWEDSKIKSTSQKLSEANLRIANLKRLQGLLLNAIQETQTPESYKKIRNHFAAANASP